MHTLFIVCLYFIVNCVHRQKSGVRYTFDSINKTQNANKNPLSFTSSSFLTAFTNNGLLSSCIFHTFDSNTNHINIDSFPLEAILNKYGINATDVQGIAVKQTEYKIYFMFAANVHIDDDEHQHNKQLMWISFYISDIFRIIKVYGKNTILGHNERRLLSNDNLQQQKRGEIEECEFIGKIEMGDICSIEELRIEFLRVLGEGAHGIVYQAIMYYPGFEEFKMHLYVNMFVV